MVSRLAVGAEKAPVELQGDIAAIAQALNLGSEGQARIADLDAYFTKQFGVKQGSTLETVAQYGERRSRGWLAGTGSGSGPRCAVRC